MSSDEEQFNQKVHKKLLSEINEIVKYQHIKKPKRSEPATKNDEFHLIKTKITADEENKESKRDSKSVSIKSVADIVRKNASQKKVSNQFQDTFRQNKVLDKPLEKIHADRIKRNVAYDNAKDKLSRWDAVVTQNKNADQLRFPLHQEKAFFNKRNQISGFSQQRYKTQLVKDMEDIHNECFPKSNEPETEEVSTELLTLEEMKERRKELGVLKLRESNKIAKKRMQGKIKSKKYHRLKKKEEIKRKLKEFEDLKITNPQAAIKELEKIEKQRVQERANLRHKNTGTWAKNMKIRAKYDITAKQELEQQLALGRELTQKNQQNDSSDSEDEEVLNSNSHENPWLMDSETKVDPLDEVFSGYKKFWDEKNSNEKLLKELKKGENINHTEHEQSDGESDEDESMSEEEKNDESLNKSQWMEEDVSESDNENPSNFLNELFDEAEESINNKMESKLKQLKPKLLENLDAEPKKKKKKNTVDVHSARYLEFSKAAKLGDIDEGLIENDDLEEKVEKVRIRPSKRLMNEIQSIKEEKKSFMRGTTGDINPEEFLKIKSKHLLTSIPKAQEFDEIDEDDIEDAEKINKMSLVEAFENDDIINDFVNDNEEEAKVSSTNGNGVLPGWGSWGGHGAKSKQNEDKKAAGVKKKDRVIVNTIPHDKLKKHLVSKLPFPFTTIKDFEASIRVPIGKDFIPESAHRKLTTASIVTKVGVVIEPMSEDVLVQNDANRKAGKFNKVKRRKFLK